MQPDVVFYSRFHKQIKDKFGHGKYQFINLDELVKRRQSDGTVKSSRCKVRESLGMRRTYKYVGMTKDEAQRSRWTFK